MPVETSQMPVSEAGQSLSQDPDGLLQVESLDIDAQGIAHRPDGKVVFVEGALPFEQVRVRVTRSKVPCPSVRCAHVNWARS